MKHRLPSVTIVLLALATALPGANGTTAKALAAANDAWERGDYISALGDYIKLLEAPGGEAMLEPIALQTGELFVSRELTTDGRNPRFSPDARFIGYEIGPEVSLRTKIVRHDSSLTQVADLPGVSATFSPTGSTVAYLKLADTPSLVTARNAIEQAPLDAKNRTAIRQALRQALLTSTVAIRDLASGVERELVVEDLLKSDLVYGADGRTFYFLGGRQDGQNDIYAIPEGSAARVVGDAAGLKSAPIVDPSGAVLLYTVPAPQGPGRGGAGGERRPPSFGIIDLATNKTTVIEGEAPSFSGDGKTLAYIVRAGSEYRLMVGPPRGPMAAVKKTTERLDAPALSADGQRLAYQMMQRDDWEIFTANRDGSGEARLTRDIAHDLLPRFVGNDTVLALFGEPRHRRASLFDIKTGARTRIFHNNTVRTIAPEYQWVLSAEGRSLLIGAERDGDTVSLQRGVYVVDLQNKIDKPELLKRLRANLASETALRALGTKAFAPIADDVRKVVNSTSVARVYGFEKALFDFDSKNISRPGNKLAAEYLFNTYASFGYEPEYQTFEHKQALGGKTSNVLATLRGTVNPELIYVVSSHYDSVAGGPGADDDSSGTAALLEAARVLAGHPQPATIIFASFTGEESGLLGSREFVRRAVEGKMQVAGALNNDMIGFANDHRLDNTIRYSNPGIRDIQHGAAMLFTRLITYDALYFKGTDAAAYYDAYGDIVGGIGSYPVLSNPHYHQPHDLLEFENHELIAETSKTTTATLMLLASSPSRLKDLKVESFTGGVASLSWTPSPEKGVVSYVVSYGGKSMKVTTPRVKLAAIAPGTVVSVKAVNAKGLEGWDWARVMVN